MVQLTSVSSNYGLGENCLNVCTQWGEDLVAEQDSDSIALEYSQMIH